MNRVNLVETLNVVEQALSDQNLVEIFKCFCFKNGQVYAFNDVLGIVAPCDVKETFAVNGKTLLGLLQCGSTDEVNFELDEHDLLVKCGKSEMALPYFPESNFIFDIPELPPFFANLSREGLSVCLTTASRDETKKAIMGVAISPNYLYSCDGDALTRYQLPNQCPVDGDPILLSNEFCNVICKFASDPELFLGTDWATAQCNGISVFGKLRKEDKFDYKGSLKSALKGTPTYVSTTTALEYALRRARIIADVDGARTILQVSNNKLFLTTETALGVVNDDVPFEHPNITVNVSAALVHRALGVCNEMAIMPNCTVYRKGETVLQLLGNMA